MPREQLFEQQAAAILESGDHVAGVRDLRPGTPVQFLADIATPAGGQTAMLTLHEIVQ
jgi:hypothetical protein